MFDFAGPFGFEAPNEKDILALTGKLRSLESMTWNEIFQSKRRNHTNAIVGFAPAAQRRLRERQLDDFEELHSIRLTGVERIYGVWREGVFYAIWWDRSHRCYPSKKKHT